MLNFQSVELCDLMKEIQSLVCVNQAGLSQYWFEASERHKNLKSILQDQRKVPSLLLKESLESFEAYLYDEFYNAFRMSLTHVMNSFQARSSIQPRCCLKVIAGNEFVTLFRHPSSLMMEGPYSVNENSAFKEIANGSRSYYLSNNLPKDIAEGKYTNPRISQAEVKKYYESYLKSKLFDHENANGIDFEWLKCWRDVFLIDIDDIQSSPPDTCYKSTLVIPMSLKTQTLRTEFLKHFELNINNVRHIFGFVCFDHVGIDFFEEPFDVSLAYILSDIMSLYLICQLACTQYSSIYHQVREMISN
jgi:hypothetical protein